jgi:hypothetical protein
MSDLAVVLLPPAPVAAGACTTTWWPLAAQEQQHWQTHSSEQRWQGKAVRAVMYGSICVLPTGDTWCFPQQQQLQLPVDSLVAAQRC